ncbi:MAG: hypothetical protein A2V66_09675 [Ignavibacteria bacterium RBG_13_36_8]|nr:MAG: hypothetical protein A2V66_09675 [Ignavibacteria bacterium RBG_13_36_8]
MHNKDTVLKYRKRIFKAVEELFNLAIKNQETMDDIVCFLCNGQNNYGYNMFGPGERGITDRHQSEFLIDFMNTSEESVLLANLNSDKEKERLERYSLNIELMIYSHLWEMEWSLSNLMHLANFVEGIQYDWKLKIPWQEKWEFITKTIRAVFEKSNLDIANLLKETYHSQLRNAFAHGQYGLSWKIIQLYNFTGKSYELSAITFEDWEVRFIKTVDIFIEIANQKFQLLKKYSIEKPVLRVWTPVKYPTRFRRTEIYWDEYAGYYSFNKNVLKTT